MSTVLGEQKPTSPYSLPAAEAEEVMQQLTVVSSVLRMQGCACSAFYERIKEVREYHRRYPYLEVAEVSSASSMLSLVSLAGYALG